MANQWQPYVDNNLVGAGGATQAAIFGLDGNKWAGSAGFNVSTAEVKPLIAAFDTKNQAGITTLRNNGLTLNATKFIILKADDRSIYGKKGATGVVCVKTNKAVIISFYNEKIQPGTSAAVTEKIADYLIGLSY